MADYSWMMENLVDEHVRRTIGEMMIAYFAQQIFHMCGDAKPDGIVILTGYVAG
jgi:hypothetical protein